VRIAATPCLVVALCLAAAAVWAKPLHGEPPAASSEPSGEGRAVRFRQALPPPLPGWRADEAEEGSGPAALLGGGPSASRRYYALGQADRTVDVEVVADSPLAESLAPLLADPALLAGAPGSAVVGVKGRAALRRLAPGDRTAELSLLLGSRGLVVVRGQGVDGAEEVTAYTEALDFGTLEGLLRP
jgi:hypothetical protein